MCSRGSSNEPSSASVDCDNSSRRVALSTSRRCCRSTSPVPSSTLQLISSSNFFCLKTKLLTSWCRHLPAAGRSATTRSSICRRVNLSRAVVRSLAHSRASTKSTQLAIANLSTPEASCGDVRAHTNRSGGDGGGGDALGPLECK